VAKKNVAKTHGLIASVKNVFVLTTPDESSPHTFWLPDWTL